MRRRDDVRNRQCPMPPPLGGKELPAEVGCRRTLVRPHAPQPFNRRASSPYDRGRSRTGCGRSVPTPAAENRVPSMASGKSNRRRTIGAVGEQLIDHALRQLVVAEPWRTSPCRKQISETCASSVRTPTKPKGSRTIASNRPVAATRQLRVRRIECRRHASGAEHSLLQRFIGGFLAQPDTQHCREKIGAGIGVTARLPIDR